jgi:hypothetical protein
LRHDAPSIRTTPAQGEVMPALFAYLIAVGLLLGGGYGALNWLAAPEPVKVVERAKPTSHREPKREAMSEVSSSETSSDAQNLDQSEQAMARPNGETPPPSPPSDNAVAREQGAAQAADVSNSTQEPARTGKAEIPSTESLQQSSPQVVQPAPARSAVSTGSKRAAVSSAQAESARTAKRQHKRQASNRPEKSGAVLMILRTIQFPDGRRVTQLVPYRPSERVLVFDPDD